MLARRGDGLGERLNALLNAMRLGEILGVDFRFTWPMGKVGADPHHAIVPADEFFSAAFVAAHHLEHADTKDGFPLPTGPDDDLESLRTQLASAERGLRAGNLPLSHRIDAVAVPAITRGFATEFAAVGFHPRIDAAIEAAQRVPLPDFSAGIHLRAGDNLFGRYRTWTQYWYKVVPVPVARALVERFRDEGRHVLVFGQDADLIADLCSTTGAVDAATLRPAGRSAAEDAMFDLVLMSRCERIVSGWSGFAIQAASIADKSVEGPYELIPPREAIALTEQDVASHGNSYDATHRAFAWWAAYYAARDELSLDDAIPLVESALEADPTNPRYRLRLAALHYRGGGFDQGDSVLIEALRADAAAGGATLESVLLFSLLTVLRFDSTEIFGDFEVAVHDGPGPASLYRAALRARQGDPEGAAADLATFRAFAAGERLMDVVDDAMVAATVERELKRAGRPG